MSNPFVIQKWGQAIDNTANHISYLEDVQRRFPEKPNFRGDELAESRRYLAAVKSEMKRLGKRRSSGYYPHDAEAATRIAREKFS